MNTAVETLHQVEAVGIRNEARLALGEAAYAAATSRRLVRWAATILPGSDPLLSKDIAATRAYLTDALAALDKIDAPAKVVVLEAAE